MDEIWRGGSGPCRSCTSARGARIMFPETGRDIPFTIENYAFVDDFGRETVSLIRTFELRERRRFDAYMVYSEARGRMVDYLGSHEHLAVDLDLSVDAERRPPAPLGRPAASTRGRSGSGSRSPLSGGADVREWFDEATGRYRISVDVRNRRLGPALRLPRHLRRRVAAVAPGWVPAHILPIRQERRD